MPIVFTPNVRRTTLLLMVTLVVSVALLAYAYAVSDSNIGSGTSDKHGLSGPIGANGIVALPSPTSGLSCKPLDTDAKDQCTLGMLLRRLGQPEKYRIYHPVKNSHFETSFELGEDILEILWLNKGLYIAANYKSSIKWESQKVVSYEYFEPTTWGNYVTKYLNGSEILFRDWGDFNND